MIATDRCRLTSGTSSLGRARRRNLRPAPTCSSTRSAPPNDLHRDRRPRAPYRRLAARPSTSHERNEQRGASSCSCTIAERFPAAAGRCHHPQRGGPLGVAPELGCSVSRRPRPRLRPGPAATRGTACSTSTLLGRTLGRPRPAARSDLPSLPWFGTRSRLGRPETLRPSWPSAEDLPSRSQRRSREDGANAGRPGARGAL